MTLKTEDRYVALVTMLTTGRDDAQVVLDEFKVKLEKNPVHAFTWGDGAIEAAAKQSIFVECLRIAEQVNGQEKYDHVVDTILKMLCDNRDFYAVNPLRTTSTTSNLLTQYKLAAVVELINRLNLHFL